MLAEALGCAPKLRLPISSGAQVTLLIVVIIIALGGGAAVIEGQWCSPPGPMTLIRIPFGAGDSLSPPGLLKDSGD